MTLSKLHNLCAFVFQITNKDTLYFSRQYPIRVLFCSPGVSHPYLFNTELFSIPQISHVVAHLCVFIMLFHPPVSLFSPSWVTSTHP